MLSLILMPKHGPSHYGPLLQVNSLMQFRVPEAGVLTLPNTVTPNPKIVLLLLHNCNSVFSDGLSDPCEKVARCPLKVENSCPGEWLG